MSENPPYTTSDAGVPATSHEHSLTVGPDGRSIPVSVPASSKSLSD